MRFIKSSGNVFKDLGFGAAEAQNLLIRSTLMSSLLKILEKRKLDDKSAAALFGVDLSFVRALKSGEIDQMNLDLLLAMLNHAGVNVKLVLSKCRVAAAQRRIFEGS